VLQSDLIDFSNSARSSDNKKKYALVISDVYTRKSTTKAIDDKTQSTVNAAFNEIVEKNPGQDVVVTTDQGKEFTSLDDQPGVIHRTKEKKNRNSISVVDRMIQTLKKDISADIADEGGRWDSKLEDVTKAYNSRPHSHTTVAPNDVEENGVADFKILQTNAKNYAINANQTVSRQTRLRESGAFRVAEPNPRSFNAQYSDKVFNVRNVKGDRVMNTSGKSFLLTNVQPVPKGSTRPLGRMTDVTLSRKTRFEERANDVVEMIAGRGGQMNFTNFEKAIRAGDAEGLIKVLRRNAITIRNFLRIYPDKFTVRNGIVKLKIQADVQEPEVPEPEVPEPAASSSAPAPRRRLTLIGDDEASARVGEALRKQKNYEKFANIRTVYGDRPM
jgi:hypothetical protein